MTRLSSCGPPIQANRGGHSLIALLTGASLPAIARRDRSPDAMFGDGQLARLRIAGLL